MLIGSILILVAADVDVDNQNCPKEVIQDGPAQTWLSQFSNFVKMYNGDSTILFLSWRW